MLSWSNRSTDMLRDPFLRFNIPPEGGLHYFTRQTEETMLCACSSAHRSRTNVTHNYILEKFLLLYGQPAQCPHYRPPYSA